MPRKTRDFPIPKGTRLYCPECTSVQDVEFTDPSNWFDAALLKCGHSRSAYVPPTGVSLEAAWSPEGQELFPGDKKRTLIDATVGHYRRETFYK